MESPRTRDEVLRRLRESSTNPLMTEFPHGALFAFDQDLRVLAVGGDLLDVMGMSRDDIVGLRPGDLFPPESVARIEPSWRAVLEGGTSRQDVPYGDRWFQHELAPIRVAGEVIGGMGFLQEVTGVRDADRALAESEQRMRLWLVHAPIGMAIVEPDGRWREVNPALCRLLGYPEDELLGMKFQDLTHPDDLDTDLELLGQLLDGEITDFEIEKRYVAASGAVISALLSVALVSDDDGTPLYFVTQIQDITERKRQHDAMRDLTAMMAHDLRGPIGVMGGLLELLSTGWETRTDEQRLEMVRRAARTARVTQDLLHNALTASTLDQHEIRTQASRIEVPVAIGTVLTTVPLPDVTVDVDCPDDATCWADPAHLVQALSNLVTNAVKYGGDALHIEVVSRDGVTSIAVTDDGPGVPAEFEPLLFERFSRSASARAGVQKGSGLGLYIVRDLMRLNGGDVAYAAAPGGGACFTLRLPTSSQ